ncbi:hypothetical protein BYT27DRAFT_7252782 [Phlegmacium glaucopus]|nr:hypothetical protein BYT27DRAFT_7252782 [Phlegmacium glaucopus]
MLGRAVRWISNTRYLQCSNSRQCTPSRYLSTSVIEAGSASRSKDDENLAVLDTYLHNGPYTSCPGPSAPPPAHPSHRRCHIFVGELVGIVPDRTHSSTQNQPKTLGDKSLPHKQIAPSTNHIRISSHPSSRVSLPNVTGSKQLPPSPSSSAVEDLSRFCAFLPDYEKPLKLPLEEYGGEDGIVLTSFSLSPSILI